MTARIAVPEVATGGTLRRRLAAVAWGRAGKSVAIVVDLALVYVIWEVLSATGVLPAQFFPDANAVISRLVEFVGLPAFWVVVGQTMQSWAIGLAIGAVAGTLVGILLGSSERAYRFCRVVIEVMRPIPPIVLIPLAVLVLGTSLQMKLVLIFQGIFWVIVLQAVYGVHSVDPVRMEMGRSYGLSRPARFFRIQLPGALPFIATGIRIAAIFALIISIVAELVGGAHGLGAQILVAQSAGDDRTMYALIFVTGVLGVVITLAFSYLERRVLFWHPSQRAELK